MATELKVPEVGESVTEVEIGAWLKSPGQAVLKDEPVVTLESEKATVELVAPETGTMGRLLKEKGASAKVGEVIAYLEKGPASPAVGDQPKRQAPPAKPAPEAEIKPAEPRIMPAAEAALEQYHLRPEQVQGHGPGG